MASSQDPWNYILVSFKIELHVHLPKQDTFQYGQTFFTVVSILNLILVTADRHLSIIRPLQYVTMITTFRVFVITGIKRMIGIVFGVASMVDTAYDDSDSSITQLCSGIRYTDPANRIFFLATGVAPLLLGVTMVTLNLRILGIARRQSQRITIQNAVRHRDDLRHCRPAS